MGKKQLLDSDSDEPEKAQLQVNEDFANRFEHNKRREHLEKAKNKYGAKELAKMMAEQEGVDAGSAFDSSSESSSSEDDAALVTNQVQRKFIETIARIRTNDPTLRNQENDLFVDQDFDEEEEADVSKQTKKITYKDMLKEDDGESEDEDMFRNKKPGKETAADEQARLKREFKAAISGQEDISLTKKETTQQEMDVEDMEYDKFIKQQRSKQLGEKEVLKRFWGQDSKLSKEDQFLRNYILAEGWKDRGDNAIKPEVDKEDEGRDEEMEKFEEQYNFRFEDKTGAYLTTFAR